MGLPSDPTYEMPYGFSPGASSSAREEKLSSNGQRRPSYEHGRPWSRPCAAVEII